MAKGQLNRFNILPDKIFTIVVVVAPFAIVIALILYPLIHSLHNSFLHMFIHRPDRARFIGFDNYVRIAADSQFWNTLRITAIFTFFTTLFSMIIAMLAAGLLNARVYEKTVKGKNLIRSVLLVPFVMSQAVLGAVMASYFWGARLGLINLFLRSVGIRPPVWFGSADTALFAVIITDAWRAFPLAMLILDSALRAIPRSLYDESTIEGASLIQRYRYIIFPLIMPQLIIVMIIRITTSWRMFDLIFLMTGGGPGRSTQTLSLYIYTFFMRYLEFGYASALSWIMILTLALICGATVVVMKRTVVSLDVGK